jgi:hypothetical protein
LALSFPFFANSSSLVRLTLTMANSDKTKKPLRKTRNIAIINIKTELGSGKKDPL